MRARPARAARRHAGEPARPHRSQDRPGHRRLGCRPPRWAARRSRLGAVLRRPAPRPAGPASGGRRAAPVQLRPRPAQLGPDRRADRLPARPPGPRLAGLRGDRPALAGRLVRRGRRGLGLGRQPGRPVPPVRRRPPPGRRRPTPALTRLALLDGPATAAVRDQLMAVYRAAMGAAPFHETEVETGWFAEELAGEVTEAGFRCWAAYDDDGQLAGFAYRPADPRDPGRGLVRQPARGRRSRRRRALADRPVRGGLDRRPPRPARARPRPRTAGAAARRGRQRPRLAGHPRPRHPAPRPLPLPRLPPPGPRPPRLARRRPGRARRRPAGGRLVLEVLEDPGRALAAADAHGDHAVAGLAAG